MGWVTPSCGQVIERHGSISDSVVNFVTVFWNKGECNMKRKNLVLLLGAVLLCGSVTIAQEPVQNIDGKRHPNLRNAQNSIVAAFHYIDAAQKDNDWDMEGHAQKAKDLLKQASEELKEAAEISNQAHHK